ncbi:Arc-like DNA binding protein [Paenibacillus phage Rosalind]|uniref:Arc-like DNA binding domain protein n=6 Tax=root TaxID=1 RepID=A0A0K2CYW4_9CAUD|nr:Arc-like DNA binding domain protein [Paenibacillus phage Vegas]ALA12764.1 Arc-like DNA binding domain protein [Paenibacillus phage Hayley]ALA12850.1 Arc-like DNA binding domain protein [Paenibacillus phage Vadim]ALA12936.1 Arc-like DNA binding domain protein [Paenibacillus phage Diane]AQR77658.1 Arc family DNA binding domain-containing protein [Paenibacillus larvae subsp. larvae]UYE92054.1 Arc-like DNA binding protein [Paenibacillus phage LunBun]UYE92136.1 Arc-like DNA binding protein [Pae
MVAKRRQKDVSRMEEQKRFTLRLDLNLFERIKKQAEINKRSIAKEIEHMLEQQFKQNEDNTG